jgi:hypothetical protein
MTKIKLPRKRKKAFKKSHERGGYYMIKMLLEILHEEEPIKDNRRFYKLVSANRKQIKHKNNLTHNFMFILKRY